MLPVFVPEGRCEFSPEFSGCLQSWDRKCVERLSAGGTIESALNRPIRTDSFISGASLVGRSGLAHQGNARNRFAERDLQLTCYVARYKIPQRIWTRSRRLSPQRLLGGFKIVNARSKTNSGCLVRPNESAIPSRAQPHHRYPTPLLVSNG